MFYKGEINNLKKKRKIFSTPNGNKYDGETPEAGCQGREGQWVRGTVCCEFKSGSGY